MPNANAIVDKLKDLGLRHGEKAGVAVASVVFLLCVATAAMKPTIDITPEQIKTDTQRSDRNLNRIDDRDKIVKNLEDKGIKASNFAKVVDDQVKTALNADDYKPLRDYVSPEPGAGLIRDTPVLITATELYAYPGRGGLLVYELDEKTGERIVDTGTDQPKDQARRRRKRKRPAGGMGGMGGGGMMGGMAGARKKPTKSKDDIAREAREDLERKRKTLAAKLAGSDQPEDEKAKAEAAAAQEPPSKEITKGYRWVALTGVLDHAKMLANYRDALKNSAVAHPNYKRLDVERKMLQPDGSWSEWRRVSSDENLKVLDNLPEEDEELTPDSVRPDALCDPLPFLKAGLWEKVHIASLVPLEKKKIDEPSPAAGGMGGGMMGGRGMGGGMMGAGGMGGGMMGGGMMGGGKGGAMAGGGMMGGMMGGAMMGGGGRGGLMRGGMMGGGMGGGMGGSTETVESFWKSDAKRVMIRALDFTVEPDTTYRYRVRIVVFNPNKNREDVAAGVDTKADELRGGWSEATDEVHMPPDVMPYLTATDSPGPATDMPARFQVIRFNPVDGVTVPHNFMATPGEVIGESRPAQIPVSDGSGSKSKNIDFNSRQIVLDLYVNKNRRDLPSTWGKQPLPPGFVGAPIDRPALALLLRPDGSVVLHGEVDDVGNDVRKDIKANYDYEIGQSTKERKRSVGTGMMGMMGGMGGMGGRMMGGGMGGGAR